MTLSIVYIYINLYITWMTLLTYEALYMHSARIDSPNPFYVVNLVGGEGGKKVKKL